MEPIDLQALIAVRRETAGGQARFVLDVPDGLQQGRGAWGGVATGAMVSAAQQVDPRPEMQVRNVTAQLVAPLLVGRAYLDVSSLRVGSATTTLAVRISDGSGALIAHAVIVLGAGRRGSEMPDGAKWTSLSPPDGLAQGPFAVPVIQIGPPLAPEFVDHMQFRPLTGLPYSGSPEALTTGWVRPRCQVTKPDSALVAALADAWWVSAMATMLAPRPAATLGFTLDLPADPGILAIEPDGLLTPLMHRGRVIAAREGFCVETRELWTAGGDLVSWNTQTVVVIK